MENAGQGWRDTCTGLFYFASSASPVKRNGQFVCSLSACRACQRQRDPAGSICDGVAASGRLVLKTGGRFVLETPPFSGTDCPVFSVEDLCNEKGIILSYNTNFVFVTDFVEERDILLRLLHNWPSPSQDIDANGCLDSRD